MFEYVVHADIPFTVNGNTYQRGDVLLKSDEASVQENFLLRAQVTRRLVAA